MTASVVEGLGLSHSDYHDADELIAEAMQIRDERRAGFPPTPGPWCEPCGKPMWVHHPTGPDEFCDCESDEEFF